MKAIARLRSRRSRDRQRRFTIEGFREVRRAVEHGVKLEAVVYCPDMFLGTNEAALLDAAAASGAELVAVGADVFRKLSYRDRPEGLVAVAPHFDTSLGRLDRRAGGIVLVVEAIEKPGNLGTMLRTACAAGVTSVIVADPTTDVFNPNVVRSSLGCLFAVPLAVATTPDTLEFLRNGGFRMVAATPGARRRHWDADLTAATAIVVGSEQYGLSEEWLAAADERVAIPMPGAADSLNAATAAAVLVYEAVRQRAARND